MSSGCWHRAGPLLLLQPDPPSKAASPSNYSLERLPAEPADGSDVWFKAHPKEEPMGNHVKSM